MIILDGDSFRGLLTRQVPVESREQLSFARHGRRELRSAFHFSSYAYVGVCVCRVSRAIHFAKRKIHWTDARIDSEGRFFHRQRLVALNSFSCRERKRGPDI